MCTEYIAVVLLWSLVVYLAIYFSGSQCTFLVYCTVCACFSSVRSDCHNYVGLSIYVDTQ